MRRRRYDDGSGGGGIIVARPTRVFFAGSLRRKLCGKGPAGEERHFESSRGVRAALTPQALRRRYPARFADVAEEAEEEEDAAESFSAALLRTSGLHIRLLGTSAHGGGRIGGRASYADDLRSALFCLHLRGDTPTSRRFFDAVAAGCLPIVVCDAVIFIFER